MSGPQPEALQAFASAQGLLWKEEDTLPPATERLRWGIGVGEHRSSLRTVTDRGMTVTEGQKKRPERQTLGVCSGRLPGGLEGKLGHHVHLSDQGRGHENRYIATVDTVVFAELGTRGRPVFNLEGGPGGNPEVKAGLTIGGKKKPKGPVDMVVPQPKGRIEAGGMRWTSFPAESDERIRRIVSASTRNLDRLQTDRIAVEYESGLFAVWVRGRALTDSASLEALCRFASGLADGLKEVDASRESVSPDQALAMPEPDARSQWVEAGADLVEWTQPPASIVAAQERYKEDVKSKATRTGWKVYGIVTVALIGFSLLVAAASLAVSWLVGELPIGIIVAVISVALGILAANRIGLEVGKEVLDDRLKVSAIPWGIEAFANGYSEQSGLARENPEELRRRVDVPFRGRVQIAWQGELAPGKPGHLSIWIDPTETPDSPRFYLLAVTAATGREAPDGYQSLESNGQRLTWQEVSSVQRATHRLDQLREAA